PKSRLVENHEAASQRQRRETREELSLPRIEIVRVGVERDVGTAVRERFHHPRSHLVDRNSEQRRLPLELRAERSAKELVLRRLEGHANDASAHRSRRRAQIISRNMNGSRARLK